MNELFMNAYHRLPVVFREGQGAWLTDIDGKRYLDFTAGVAVNCLGHGHPELVEAISRQAASLIHTSNYFMSDIAIDFAQRLIKACAPAGMKKVFLANSGAEANEGACKLARKYSLKKYGEGRHRIVTLQGSFHGRTITTLAATGQDKFHKDFGPFTEGFTHIPGGDEAALERALDPSVCGLLLEFIQGESGIVPQPPGFIKKAAKLCAERDILFMADEVQSGVGRTGTFLACEGYGVQPDIVSLAKGLAGGIPVGAVMAGEKAAHVFEMGDHGSTFGGNALAAAAGLAVLRIVDTPAFLNEIRRKGEKCASIITSWKHKQVKEVRARGLMLGIDIDTTSWPVLESALSRGLLLLCAGPNTLRLLPPYIISDEEIEQGLEILKGVLDGIKQPQ
ncbi:MAG: acetylornithine/succinylornithine family transaminase [Proteobacteria bacterium]|nr:acetylornithine/succinylornithine family transaminase [Cystobacterineae bacterium]MCL2259045.1 acetylornithine/succinylornithine family transaminase [Cystobacterineae bacterium]MCL2314603.1 acetylornithine/succinylornithine family transaminase [Pseudomonadota bacterium]